MLSGSVNLATGSTGAISRTGSHASVLRMLHVWRGADAAHCLMPSSACHLCEAADLGCAAHKPSPLLTRAGILSLAEMLPPVHTTAHINLHLYLPDESPCHGPVTPSVHTRPHCQTHLNINVFICLRRLCCLLSQATQRRVVILHTSDRDCWATHQTCQPTPRRQALPPLPLPS